MHSVDHGRRALLGAALAGGAAGLLGCRRPGRGGAIEPEQAPRLLAIANGPQTKTSRFEALDPNLSGQLVLLHLPELRAESVAVPLKGHEVVQHPREPRLVFTSEKWGSKAGLVDLKARRVERLVRAEPGTRFFGHAAYLPDGSALLCSEMDDRGGQGYVGVRDPISLALVRRVPSFGIYAHQVSLVDAHTVLALNMGAPEASYHLLGARSDVLHVESRFNLIDLESGLLRRRVPLGESGYAHFVRDAELGTVVAIGDITTPERQRSLAALILRDDRVIDLPVDAYSGEVLSAALDRARRRAYLTIPASNVCLEVDYEAQRLVDRLEVPGVKGVAVVGGQVVLSCAGAPGLQVAPISTARLGAWPWRRAGLEGLNGAHLAMLEPYA